MLKSFFFPSYDMGKNKVYFLLDFFPKQILHLRNYKYAITEIIHKLCNI